VLRPLALAPSTRTDPGPTDGSNRAHIALPSAPIPVTDGDYFECQVWQSASGSLDLEADPKTWFALEFAAFRGALVKLTADEPVADSTDVAISWGAAVYDTDGFWSAGTPTRLTVPTGVSKVRLKGNIDWTFGGTGHRHVWMYQNGGPFYGMGRESNEATPACRVSAAQWSRSRPATISS
jgi:hypothetical protein